MLLGALLVGSAVTAASHTTGMSTAGPISSLGEWVYVIAASAHLEGADNAVWRTDAVLHNPGSTSAVASLFFLEKRVNNAQTTPVPVTVPAGHSVLLGDVVLSLFGKTEVSGAILVDSTEQLIVTSRTYNDKPDGTYGQYIPGLSLDDAITGHEETLLIQLRRGPSFWTHIGFANLTGTRLEVTVRLYQHDAGLLRQQSYSLKPYSFDQVFDIIGSDVSCAYASVSSTSPDALYFAYATVVDRSSGDPIFVLPGVTAAPSERLYILAAANKQGVGTTNWKTDLEVHSKGLLTSAYSIELLKTRTDNTQFEKTTQPLLGGWSVRHTNALDELFGFSGTGALRATAGTPLVIGSKTYNQLPDKTYGQSLPGFREASAIHQGQVGRMVQLSYSPDSSSGFRTNLGFVNTLSIGLDIDASLFDGSGTLLGSRRYSLEPYEHEQLTDVYAWATNTALDNAFIDVEAVTSPAVFFAYTSVIDNLSGDPTFIPATVLGVPDPAPPTQAPTLQATALSPTAVFLSWTAVQDISGYKLFRDTELITKVNSTSFTNEGLSPGTTYCYSVAAYNIHGDGPRSQSSCATTAESPFGCGSWEALDSGAYTQLFGIAYGSGRYVVVGHGGTVVTSDDGQTWEVHSTGGGKSLYQVAWDEDGAFVAVGADGIILTSPDGMSWTERETPVQTSLTEVTCFPNDGPCMASGHEGVLLTSATGTSWELEDTGVDGILNGIAQPPFFGQWYYVIGSNAARTSGLILKSGINDTWNATELSVPYYDLAYCAPGLVAVGNEGGFGVCENGSLWRESNVGFSEHLYSVACSDERVIAVGRSGLIVSSRDLDQLATWKAEESPEDENLYSVIWDGSSFYAVGDSGTILKQECGVAPAPAATMQAR